VKGGNNATGLNDNRLSLFQGKGALMYQQMLYVRKIYIICQYKIVLNFSQRHREHREGINMTEQELNKMTGEIIGIAIEVHRELGPGLLEKVYQRCLRIALEEAGYRVEMELPLPVMFRGQTIAEDGYRIDLLVCDTVIIEIKSVSALTPLFENNSEHI